MSENKHTPEPWRTAERSGFPFHVDDARGESVAMMLADDDHDEQRGLDNARRIVACVNACAGISTENLEDNKPIIEVVRSYNEAIRQRDELLAALERIRKRQETIGATGNSAWTTADFSIASVKGGSA